MKARVIKKQDNLWLEANGEAIAPAAYMSYLEDNADYVGFQKAGYELFCACVYMGDCPINEFSGVRPFGDYIWKARDVYDFSPIYNSVRKIVGDGTRNAYIMLRVNLNTPMWWRKENPEELTENSDGKRYMQSVFSEKWKTDAKSFLSRLCQYLRTFAFSENVIAVQIAGMQTEEWLAMRTGTGALDYSLPAQKAFGKWLQKKYGKAFDVAPMPPREIVCVHDRKPLADEEKQRYFVDYMRFYGEGFARAIQEFSAHVKEACNRDLLVGTFYGYVGQTACDCGHHAVSMLLHDSNIDFFASPFAYTDARQTTRDWYYHGPMNSAAAAGKLWFLEADVRTYKTKYLADTNPELMSGEQTVQYHRAPVFKGPSTERESLWVMLRSFAKVLCSKNAFWWFDMWGGWYASPSMMALVKKALGVYRVAMNAKIEGKSRLAVALDERAYAGLSNEHFACTTSAQLAELGYLGAPYDLYLVGDMTDEQKEQYDGVLYIADQTSPSKGNTLALKNGVRVEKKGAFDIDELRAYLQNIGAHIYSAGNVVYANSRFVAITAKVGGRVALNMPFVCKIKAFTDEKVYEGKDFVFDMETNQTELFEIIG
ncbi:MAG: hypothetical protein E7352_07260 [Clostridiales bacterium]|nr:hypothetical protein [Clostridiales bacterium]